MLDSLVKLLEKLLDFLSKKSRVNKEVFEKLYAPLLKEVDEVHKDYGKTLNEAKKVLEKKSRADNISQAIELLEGRRKEFVLIREKLTDYSKFMKENATNQLEKEVCSSLSRYFNQVDETSPVGPISHTFYTSILAVLHSINNANVSKANLEREFTIALSSMYDDQSFPTTAIPSLFEGYLDNYAENQNKRRTNLIDFVRDKLDSPTMEVVNLLLSSDELRKRDRVQIATNIIDHSIATLKRRIKAFREAYWQYERQVIHDS